MAEYVVQPWRKYGHDRLYVRTADGKGLGYVDNKTGAVTLEAGSDRAQFDAAIAAHHGVGRSPSPNPDPLVPPQRRDEAPAPELPPVEEPNWNDLAARKPGEAARAQALALRDAAPIRTLVARALGVKTDERNWRIGADAEEKVAGRLAKLGDAWKILHAVPVGENGSDIDHVAIGPGGIYTINTKHHPDGRIYVRGDTVKLNGRTVPYVRNSRFEARRTSKLLGEALGGVPVSVTGLIAVMGATGGFVIRSQPADGQVVVITRREVAKWLSKRPVLLTPPQVDEIYAVARRDSTWRSSPSRSGRR